MGYEINFLYHEKNDTGYNKDETKTLKKRVGDPFEEISIEKLGSSIMAQYARRDIFVVGVEIYELTKKLVNFRETKDGIVIKNKKFIFGECTSVIIEEEKKLEETPIVEHPHNKLNKPLTVSQNGKTNGKPIKFMIFAPELHMMPDIKQKGLKFTPDKKYPVYHSQLNPTTGIGEIYKMIDDIGREMFVSDMYFVPVPVLIADRELGFSNNKKEADLLNWGSATNEPDMPDLRSKK